VQTFLPYASFKASLKCLDYRRLGKQRIEARQILFILLWGIEEDKSIMNAMRLANKLFLPKLMDENRLANMLRWQNHPAVRMWKGAEDALALYSNYAIEEWQARGYNNSMPIIQNIPVLPRAPLWNSSLSFHHAHKINLIFKDRDFYTPVFGKKFSEAAEYVEYIWPKDANDALA
jgi:hypothetical protein